MCKRNGREGTVKFRTVLYCNCTVKFHDDQHRNRSRNIAKRLAWGGRDGPTGGGRDSRPSNSEHWALFQSAGQGMDGMLSGCAERSLLGRAVEYRNDFSSGELSQRGLLRFRRQDKTYGFWPMFLEKGPI